MKNVLTISFAAFLLAACAPDAREADEEAIRQADIAWSETGETKDLQAQMEFYTDDPTPIMMPPNAPMTVGKEAILEGLRALYDVPGFSVKWQPAEVEVARSGDIGFVRGAWEMTQIDADGYPAHDKGKYIEIWKKQANGTWKVAVDIFNSDSPPALRERGVPEPREVIDLGALVTEDLPERVWGNGFLRAMNFDSSNSFNVIHWDFADGQVSGSNAYYTLFNHGGPHVDAPNHMGLEGGVNSYAVEVFSGPLKSNPVILC
jgi:ketosteroid isomerase-like protein